MYAENAGGGDAELAWEEATEGERGLSVAENRWGWSCRNSMGGGYGGGARFECTLRIAGAGDAERAWEEATEGERGWRVKFACRWVQKNQTSEK